MIDSSLAYYMNPILAILLGTLLFREKLSGLQWLAVAVTFTGLVITVIRYRQIPWIALVIGGSFAVYEGAEKAGAVRCGRLHLCGDADPGALCPGADLLDGGPGRRRRRRADRGTVAAAAGVRRG